MTIENLKRVAATMNFFTGHGIGSYKELVERCDAVATASIRVKESLRDTEQRITDIALLGICSLEITSDSSFTSTVSLVGSCKGRD